MCNGWPVLHSQSEKTLNFGSKSRGSRFGKLAVLVVSTIFSVSAAADGWSALSDSEKEKLDSQVPGFLVQTASSNDDPVVHSTPFRDVMGPQYSLLPIDEGRVTRTQLLQMARDYRDYRRRDLDPDQADRWEKACLARPLDQIYCVGVRAVRESERAEARAEASLEMADRLGEKFDKSTERLSDLDIKKMVLSSDWGRLGSTTEGRFHRYLKSVEPRESFEAILAHVPVGNSSSIPAPLLVAFAQKMEEYFPSKTAQQKSKELYRAAIAQGSADSAVLVKARFRLALLEFWGGSPAKASELLKANTRLGESDFSSRSIYWRIRSLELLGDRLRVTALRGRLEHRYPLSLHTQILSAPAMGVHPTRRMAWSSPVSAWRRSKSHLEVNEILAAAEALFDVDAPDLAGEFLSWRLDRLEASEPEVRLYSAALFQKAQAPLASFRMLTSAFREKPELQTKETLSIYYPRKLFPLVRKEALNVDPILAMALIRQESGFQPNARSRVGALGLMQLMPETARRTWGKGHSRKVNSLFDPRTNVRVGAQYFQQLVRQFEGDVDLSLAAYNAGTEKVDEWRKRYPVTDRALFLDLIPFAETRNYVALIARNYFWYREIYGGEPGFRALKLRSRMPASDSDVRRPFDQVFTWLKTL